MGFTCGVMPSTSCMWILSQEGRGDGMFAIQRASLVLDDHVKRGVFKADLPGVLTRGITPFQGHLARKAGTTAAGEAPLTTATPTQAVYSSPCQQLTVTGPVTPFGRRRRTTGTSYMSFR